CQAEDGIRDRNVTGVQTCALPILLVADGLTKDDISINLWNYYKRDLSVKSIIDTAKVLEYYGTNELTDRSFPVDTDYNFSYQSNWGDRRGFGGNRIHEGTDVFAD